MRSKHPQSSRRMGAALIVAIVGGGMVILPAPAQIRPAGGGKASVGARIEELGALLEPIRQQHDIPALAAIVVRSDSAAAVGAVGVRAIGLEEAVTPNDLFHLGSCTKAMTATLCAILVERGKLTWDRTIADAFPALVDEIRPEYRDVTLEQLLCHRGGLPDDRKPDAVFFKLRSLTGEIKAQRLKLVEWRLAEPPAAPPGSKFIYSNSGYAIAAAMAEQATGESWETLMQQYLFDALGMASAGFGSPGQVGEVDQPRGHRKTWGKLRAVPPGPLADNPAVTGPSGNVHCSLADWGKYAALHLAALRGHPRLLDADTFTRLHGDRFEQRYSFGWGVRDNPLGDGAMLNHDGSNGMWYARICLAPNQDVAVLVVANSATPGTIEAINAVTKTLLARFRSKP